MTASMTVYGPSRHSATRQNLVAVGGIADIERFSAGNDLQQLTRGVKFATALALPIAMARVG
jgi:hypothetical protein